MPKEYIFEFPGTKEEFLNIMNHIPETSFIISTITS